jgi:hypothetical protein
MAAVRPLRWRVPLPLLAVLVCCHRTEPVPDLAVRCATPGYCPAGAGCLPQREGPTAAPLPVPPASGAHPTVSCATPGPVEPLYRVRRADGTCADLNLAEAYRGVGGQRTPAVAAVESRFEAWLRDNFALTPAQFSDAVQAQSKGAARGATAADREWMAVATAKGPACIHRREVDLAMAALPGQSLAASNAAATAWLQTTYGVTLDELNRAAMVPPSK